MYYEYEGKTIHKMYVERTCSGDVLIIKFTDDTTVKCETFDPINQDAYPTMIIERISK